MGRKGDTLLFDRPVYIKSYASCVGKKEGEGPLGGAFDIVGSDNRFNEETWEKSESRMIENACRRAMEKANIGREQLELTLGGDLLNQSISTSYAMRQIGAPHLGLYGACSTMAEGLGLGAALLAAGFGENVLCTAASHFCSAERQYRYPLEYGGQRPPSAQWTATAAGALLLTLKPAKVRVKAMTIGRIFDPGVTDAGNMGAAMAQSAYETITRYLTDTGLGMQDFDLVMTGDLGKIGLGVVRQLFEDDGVSTAGVLGDCGVLLFSEEQDVCSGASGCGCSAAVLCAHILPGIESGMFRRVLFCGTGALLSPVATNQGESIPGICHLAELEVVR